MRSRPDKSGDERSPNVSLAGDEARAPATEVRDAYQLVARGDLQAMRDEVARAAPRSTARIVLEAAIAQNEGRVDRCRALYNRALKTASATELAYVVDLIAPFIVMDGDHDRYEELRDQCRVGAELAGTFSAMDSITRALRGEHAGSLAASQAALESIDEAENEVLSGRILQRLAYAALQRGEFVPAAEMATRSARTLEAGGAYRPAATAYSIAYNVHHAGTGDIDRAQVFAGKMVEAARRSGDTSLENAGLIAQYEIACECGERELAYALRNRIDVLALSEQYAERFARGIGDVILSAMRDDVAVFYANAVLLRDAVANDRPSIALASALRSLGAAAVGDFDEARRCSRNAIGLASIRDASEAAYSSRYRKLARALGTAACVLIGDNVRAQRATVRRNVDEHYGLSVLWRIAQGAENEVVPRQIMGYAGVVLAVRRAIRRTLRPGQLSAAEQTVLVMLAQGMSAPQIARHTGRSVHTIRAHTRAIIAKFEVHGRSAAIAYAQKNGLLPP